MRIKTKLTLGVGLLFMMIVVLTVVGTLYTYALKKDMKDVFEHNYHTIEYSRNMILTLDEYPQNEEALHRFEHYLNKQQHNISEPGEKEATLQLSIHFAKLRSHGKDSLASLQGLIRNDIAQIMSINMASIAKKATLAKKTASSATVWIAVTGTVCFLIAFSLLINLPNNIANPIAQLTESIKKIAQRKYEQRVHFVDHDEFGELAKSFNVMAEKLEEYNNSSMSKLLFEKKRIETLINNMHDPVIGLDENKKILFVNHEALQILGAKPEEILTKTVTEAALHYELINNLSKDLESTQPSKVKNEIIKVVNDQKEAFFEKELLHIAITPTGEKEEVSVGTVIILNNVTPFKELDAAKTNFIATVSHELKTPIASIKMSLNLLERQDTGLLNEEQRYLMESIKEDSNRLLRITGELLNISQVETGNIQLNIQQSEASQILDFAMEAVRLQAEQCQIQILIHTEPQLPLLWADAEKTAWVLINFLTNALRYSPQQSKITITIAQEDDKLCFAVMDEGKGIDSRYRTKIFDRYFQIPGSHKSGTGLGLAISKEFIEAQGGTIGLESELDKGSRFYFKLNVVLE